MNRSIRRLSLSSLIGIGLAFGYDALHAQCQPPAGTWTMDMIFPGGASVASCPGNTIAIVVRGNAVDLAGNPITLGGFGCNVDIQAPGKVVSTTINPIFTIQQAAFVQGTSVGAAGIADPQQPLPVGPIDLLRIVFEPTPVAAGSNAPVAFGTTVTFPNGFPIDNHLLDGATTCDVNALTTPPLNAVPASLSITTCPGNFIRGDCNNNGLVGGNIGDALAILKFAFLGTFAPPCLNACDSTDDDTIDVADAIKLTNWTFLGGPAPAAPTPLFPVGSAFLGDCGPDPTPGALACANPICP